MQILSKQEQDSAKATREVRITRDAMGKDFGVKAAGGIRTLARVLALIEAGATPIGTSSAPEIINEIKS